MTDRIIALIEELNDICDEFDCVANANAESNWHTACRVSAYRGHVECGIKGLYEMLNYLSGLTPRQREQLREGYRDELPA